MTETRFPTRLRFFQVHGAGLLPEPPLMLAGALGGPLIIGCLTPLRNACTLAAQDSTSTARQIFGKVFTHGLSRGWTGAATPAAAAVVQFTTLGPGYFIYLNLLGSSTAAVAAGALTESLVIYAPSTRNAQLINNAVASSVKKVPVRPLYPVGPGFTALVLRNISSNAGIRVLSTPLTDALSLLTSSKTKETSTSGFCRIGGDFLASVLCGAVSMPFNQLFNFQVTSAASLAASPSERIQLGLDFLKKQYFTSSHRGSLQLSRIVLRDTGLRSLYIGCLFSSYAALERMFLCLAKNH